MFREPAALGTAERRRADRPLDNTDPGRGLNGDSAGQPTRRGSLPLTSTGRRLLTYNSAGSDATWTSIARRTSTSEHRCGTHAGAWQPRRRNVPRAYGRHRFGTGSESSRHSPETAGNVPGGVNWL